MQVRPTLIIATAVALVAMFAATAAAKPVPGALTATKARAAAEDAILARVGLDGTLDSLRCTRAAARKFTCRGTGSMFMADETEHGYTATAVVTNVRRDGRWRTTTSVRIVHAASVGGSTGSTDGHVH
ncbi:MAG: hypothetical protein JWM86_2422 [Thermoleophilia bacterium]|nr:hypothetical protein [Thermoleophilia bacterium]